MPIEWTNKTDRKWAHHLQNKAWPAELAAEKARIIQQAAEIKNNDDIWDLAKSMREFCRDCGYWYTPSFHEMTWKITRLYLLGYLQDEDFSGFTENTQKELRAYIKRFK